MIQKIKDFCQNDGTFPSTDHVVVESACLEIDYIIYPAK